MIQDSSLESVTMMNLEPLKASFLERETSPLQVFPSSSYMVTSHSGSPFHQLPSSFPSNHGKVKVGMSQHNLTSQQLPQSIHKQFQFQAWQQSPVQADDSSSDAKSQYISSSDENSIHLPLPPQKSSNLPTQRNSIRGNQYGPLTKVKVVLWVNDLHRYIYLRERGKMNSAHAAELHQLLCTIQDKMAHPFLTPQILGETKLGRMMDSFKHGDYNAESKEVARHVTRYWRKVCRLKA